MYCKLQNWAAKRTINQLYLIISLGKIINVRKLKMKKCKNREQMKHSN